jgi:hypothetical protein
MKNSLKPLLLATLLAAALSSQAETAQAPTPGNASAAAPCHAAQHRHEGFKMHAERRAKAIQARLKLTPEQEGAWATYMAAMKLPAGFKRPDRAQIAALATPERLDMIRELRQQRESWFTQRDNATRTFYASLSVEQKKIFDESTHRHFHHGAHERTQR